MRTNPGLKPQDPWAPLTDDPALTKQLAKLLSGIAAIDPSSPGTSLPGYANYAARNSALFLALRWATQLGYRAGIRVDPRDPDWPVVMIDLPTGQVSWHLEGYPKAWDGHTTEQKYDRIHQFQLAATALEVPPLPDRGRLGPVRDWLRGRGRALLRWPGRH